LSAVLTSFLALSMDLPRPIPQHDLEAVPVFPPLPPWPPALGLANPPDVVCLSDLEDLLLVSVDRRLQAAFPDFLLVVSLVPPHRALLDAEVLEDLVSVILP
jgi:hypothetical protein